MHIFIWACSSAVEHCPCTTLLEKVLAENSFANISFKKGSRTGRGLGFENGKGITTFMIEESRQVQS